MPELPEVETVRKGLLPFIHSHVIKTSIIDSWLRKPLPNDLNTLIGQKLIDVQRRAKYLVLCFEEKKLLIHLGMTGQLLCREPNQKHDKFCLMFNTGSIIFNDSRRFGFAVWHEDSLLEHLGIEPLSLQFDSHFLYQIAQRHHTEVKVFLLDQHYIVGIGNIYASEALFMARISPLRLTNTLSLLECKKLCDAIKSVLNKSISLNGSTVHDYRNVNGEQGKFQNEFCVYQQEGKSCKAHEKCPGIQRIKQHGRSTYYCPEVQK